MTLDLAAISVASYGIPGRVRQIDLVLIGARGKVGSAFRRQLGRQQSLLRAEARVDLRLIATFDRRGFVFDPAGMVPDSVDALIASRGGNDVEKLFTYISRFGSSRTLVIDCTASDEIADLYPRLMTGGVGIVAANKRANSRSLCSYKSLQRMAQDFGVPYRYETTVGAAIPVLGPLRDLRLRGERVISIRGVLSGSLSYILHRVHEGCAFSAAVVEAKTLGYTEPNPLEDLRAIDLSRKLLVLGREAGFASELEGIHIEPLVELNVGADDDLMRALQAHDAAWRNKVSWAESLNERWVMMVQATDQGGQIGLNSVPANSQFAQLRPGENLVSISTELQNAMPLCVCGPGAGVEITAAGVLSDVIAAASQWSRSAEFA